MVYHMFHFTLKQASYEARQMKVILTVIFFCIKFGIHWFVYFFFLKLKKDLDSARQALSNDIYISMIRAKKMNPNH